MVLRQVKARKYFFEVILVKLLTRVFNCELNLRKKNDKKLIALKVSAGAVLNQSRSAALLQKHSLYFCDRNGDYLLEIPTQPVERGPLKISIIFGIIGTYCVYNQELVCYAAYDMLACSTLVIYGTFLVLSRQVNFIIHNHKND